MRRSRGDESVEARFEVCDQVLRILEAGVNADAPGLFVAHFGPVTAHLERRCQALEATPRIAHPEKPETIEHCGQRALREAAPQLEGEKARGPQEIAPPKRLVGIVFEARI